MDGGCLARAIPHPVLGRLRANPPRPAPHRHHRRSPRGHLLRRPRADTGARGRPSPRDRHADARPGAACRVLRGHPRHLRPSPAAPGNIVPARGLGCPRRNPPGDHGDLRRGCAAHRPAAGLTGGGRGQRQQSHLDRDSLSPARRRRWCADRLWLGDRAQGVAHRARAIDVGGTRRVNVAGHVRSGRS